MKNIIFIEGVSGVGKTTAAETLYKKIINQGYSASFHVEGEANNPLGLCWTAYLTNAEFEHILSAYPDYAEELHSNIIYQEEYVLLRYQTGKIKLYSIELYNELQKHEFCYNPTNIVPISKFTEIFSNRWKQFLISEEIKQDYIIFDASLISNMTSDLIRNYTASAEEIIQHINKLIQIILPLNPIIFYLSSNDVRERLIKARYSRGQIPLINEQIIFWEERKQMDLNVIPKLSIEPIIIDITDSKWDSAIDYIKRNIFTK